MIGRAKVGGEGSMYCTVHYAAIRELRLGSYLESTCWQRSKNPCGFISTALILNVFSIPLLKNVLLQQNFYLTGFYFSGFDCIRGSNRVLTMDALSTDLVQKALKSSCSSRIRLAILYNVELLDEK